MYLFFWCMREQVQLVAGVCLGMKVKLWGSCGAWGYGAAVHLQNIVLPATLLHWATLRIWGRCALCVSAKHDKEQRKVVKSNPGESCQLHCYRAPAILLHCYIAPAMFCLQNMTKIWRGKWWNLILGKAAISSIALYIASCIAQHYQPHCSNSGESYQLHCSQHYQLATLL